MGQVRLPSNSEYLAQHGRGYADGEIQTFRDYRRQLSHAAVARREVLDHLEAPVAPETLRERVWVQKWEVEKRR